MWHHAMRGGIQTMKTCFLCTPLYQTIRYRHSGLFIPKIKGAYKPVHKLWKTPLWNMRGKAPHLQDSLQDKLAKKAEKVKIPDEMRIDIGLPKSRLRRARSECLQVSRRNRQNVDMEREARLGTLEVPLTDINEEWMESSGGQAQIYNIAEHYGIYRDLFGIKAYFNAVVRLSASFPASDDENEVIPVHYGNVVTPEETKNKPVIEYKTDNESALWTLMLTSLDGHLLEEDKEYLHWLVVNIPGSDIDKGDELCDYLQSIPAKGSGYHRMVFLLFRQEEPLTDIKSNWNKPCLSLKQRTFSTKTFYSQYENVITPAGFCFYQTQWDESVSDTYHKVLKMRQPMFEYIHKPTYIRKQQRTIYYADEYMGFNLYMDQYRDPKEMKRQILKKRLKNISPFKADPKRPKYPGIFKLDMSLPSWYRDELKKERQGFGMYKGLEDPFALDEDWEVSYHRPKYVKPWEKAEKYKTPEIWEPENKKTVTED